MISCESMTGRIIFPKAARSRSPSSMALLKEYTKEQLNYFRICYATTDILAEGLREIFKQEWDKQHKLTKENGKTSLGMEWTFITESLPVTKEEMLILTMKNGNRGEWVCTMLFYAILFSDCVGPRLSATVSKHVDDLRNFTNQEFAHIIQGSLSDIDFQNAISKVEVTIQALRLPAVKPQDLKN